MAHKKLWDGFIYLKAAEPLWRGRLFFTTNFPKIPEFIWLASEGLKTELTLEPFLFEHRTPGLGTKHLNH